MKPGLQLRLHQQLTLTPQLQLAIRLLQLSQLELETELRELAESNPLLEFDDDAQEDEAATEAEPATAATEYATADDVVEAAADRGNDGEDNTEWADNGGASAETPIDFSSSVGNGAASRGDDDFEPQNAAPETLQQHLGWQLNLAGFNPRQTAIATVIIDALNADGYLADGIEAAQAALPADLVVGLDEI
ncbi:MAG TPA: RNA polymerase factor sigma-54, partial [Rhodanobacter sp.]|nr:RNA polymerase factor sigma-54 [Rhodanobacter sp.]